MKLISITPFHSMTILGIRTPQIRIRPSEDTWKNWRISVRGAAVFIESPPGWRLGHPPEGMARQVAEIPRSQCYLEWEVGEGERVEDLGVAPRVDAGPVRLDAGRETNAKDKR